MFLYPNKQLAIHAIEIGMEVAARVLPQVEPKDESHLAGQLTEASYKHEEYIVTDDKYLGVNDLERLYDIGRCNPFLLSSDYTCWDYTVVQRSGVFIEERIEQHMEVSSYGRAERHMRPDLLPATSHASDRRRLSAGVGVPSAPPVCGTETTTPPPLEELRATVALQKSYQCNDSPCWKNSIVRAIPRCPPKQQCSASDISCNATIVGTTMGAAPNAASSPADGAAGLCWRETHLTVVFENFNITGANSNWTAATLTNTTESSIGLNLLRRFRSCTDIDENDEEFSIYATALGVYDQNTAMTNATFNYSRPNSAWFKDGNAHDYVHDGHPFNVNNEGACYHVNEEKQEVAYHRHNFAFLAHAAGGGINTGLFDPVNRAAYGEDGLIDDLTVAPFANNSCAAKVEKCYCDDVCHLAHFDDCCTRCRPADHRVGVYGGIDVCINWRSWIQSKFTECPARVVPPWARPGAYPSFEAAEESVDLDDATMMGSLSSATDATTCAPPPVEGPVCPESVKKAVPQAWREALPYVEYTDGCDQERNSMDINIPDFAGVKLWMRWRCTCPVIDANIGAVAVHPFDLIPGLNGWTLDVNNPDSSYMFKTCHTDADCGGCASVCTSHEGTSMKDCRSPPNPNGDLNAAGTCLRHFKELA